MTRSSPLWLPIGFVIALIGVGFKYWQLPALHAPLPAVLLGPGLVAVGVVAMLLRAFGTGRFVRIWLTIALTVPAAVAIRWAMVAPIEATAQAFGRDFGIALALGVIAALAGTAIGSLLLLRSSRRPD